MLDKLCRVRSVHAGEARARVLCVYRSPTPRTSAPHQPQACAMIGGR